MAQLFISYSTRNAEFARYLRGLLQDAGFDVWMDEAKLSAGQSWTDTLEANITHCAAFVIIMSPESKASDWVRRERLLAEKLHKPIFPILFSGEAWWDLANIQYEDMRAGLKARLSPRMIDALRAAIRGEAAVAESEPTGTHTPVPAPFVPQTDSRKLEAAMPAESKAGSDTEVWAKISLPASEGLRGELPAVVPSGDVIKKEDARASTFPIRFPVDAQTGQRLPVQAELRVSAGDFLIAAPGERIEVEIPPDSDSRTVIFTLEAKPQGKTSGRSRIVIDLIYDAKIIAQISVSTVLVERVTAAVPAWNLSAVGYVSPSAGEIAPGASAELSATPAMKPSEPTIEQDRGVFGSQKEASAEVDADEALPTYDEDFAKKRASVDDLVPQPQPQPRPEYSGSATRSTEPFDDALPMPARPAPRRASNTPLRLASVFAGLALVFVVMLAISNQAHDTLDANPTLREQTQFALLPTLTSSGSSTENRATQQAATSIAATLNAQAVVTNEIAVAPMLNCSGGPGTGLVHALRDAGLGADLLDSGIAREADARKLTAYRVVVWGGCSGSTLTMNVELLQPLRNRVADPQTVQAQLAPETLTQGDSHAVRLVRALTDYAAGRDVSTLPQIFQNLTREANSDAERTALRILWGNSLYYAGEYSAATQVYR